jgi:hypothetical protein
MGVDMQIQQTQSLRITAEALVAATNAYDTDRALKLFASNAVIDDPSTGHCFDGHEGIRTYIERYFIGYHTVTQILSMERKGEAILSVRVDFTGDFGHEIGILVISTSDQGLIERIDANLE